MAARKKTTTKRSTSKRNGAKKKTTVPAVRHLKYDIPIILAGSPNFYYFDLFQHLSLVNRRMYRQGQLLYIKKITITSPSTKDGKVSASTAPLSWVTHGAHRAAFKLWMEMRKGHGGAPGSGLPKGVSPATWADFKVYLSDGHRTALAAQLPMPVDLAGNQVVDTDAEWTHARFISPDDTGVADEFTAHLLGANVGAAPNIVSAGIIQGYEESRRTVQKDETGSEINVDSWMINLFDDGTTLDEIAEDLKEDNDFPPYQYNQYSGGATNMPFPLVQQQKAIVQQGAGNATSGGTAPSVTLGNIVAPCGLLLLNIENNAEGSADVFEVLIEVQEGPAKGVKALPM